MLWWDLPFIVGASEEVVYLVFLRIIVALTNAEVAVELLAQTLYSEFRVTPNNEKLVILNALVCFLTFEVVSFLQTDIHKNTASFFAASESFFSEGILAETNYDPSCDQFDYDHDVGDVVDERMVVKSVCFPCQSSRADDCLAFVALDRGLDEVNVLLIGLDSRTENVRLAEER
jgi:hypothetical protein